MLHGTPCAVTTARSTPKYAAAHSCSTKCPPGQELAGRVIHRRDEAQPRPAALQPVVAAPVPQEHEPGLGLAIPAAPMLRRPPSAHRGHAARTEHPAHRPHRDANRGLLLGELFGAVLVVEVPALRPPHAN